MPNCRECAFDDRDPTTNACSCTKARTEHDEHHDGCEEFYEKHSHRSDVYLSRNEWKIHD